tara:strand:+ start:1211 stop:3427 length:2217 start_codon:yes stop_codon:yes gene_type:complete
MAIKRYTANSDTTITNAFESNLTKRGTDANMGASDILEIFSLYGQNGGTSSELGRVLIKFPVDEIISDRAAEDIPAVGKVNFYLKMHNAPHSQTLPRNFTLSAKKIITDWQEGNGLDMEEYKDKTYGNAGATWISASNTAAWVRMGGDYAETEYKQVFEKGTEDLEIDITTLVEDWILNGNNYGIGLQLTASEEAYCAEYYPREAVTFDQLAWLSGSGPDISSSSRRDTISAWIYIPPYLPGGKDILSWTGTGTTDTHRRLARNYQSKFNYHRDWTSGELEILTTNTLQDDAWTHIAVTDDASSATNLPTLYINGISQSVSISDTRSPSDIPLETSNFSMGGEITHIFPNWSGSIDDVSYYDRILTSTEILEIYNNGCPTNLKEIYSSQASLKNWWINGDDPRDVIRLGTPPLSASIYDQVGTYNLYATGSGTMAITASVCAGGGGILAQDVTTGQLINVEGSTLNYYTKKFFAHSSEFFFKRPVIEARWNSSIQDDRGDFYASSSMVPAADNLNTIYLYNISRGQYTDIPNYSDLELRLYATLGGSSLGNPTVGRVSTGIYSASFALETTASTVYDVWHSGSGEERVNFHTGTIDVKTHAGSTYQPNTEYYSNITNLKPIYSTDESPRLQLYVRPKDWSPTIYTVASQDIETTPIEKAAYKVYRVVDDLEVIPYGTGSDNHTIMSYDEKGNHFNLDMSLLQPDYAYGIKVAFYNPSTKSYVEQRQAWKFRVEDLDSQ